MKTQIDSPVADRIAVLLSCYNRRNITLTCLKSLYQQSIPFEVYLVDDGSTDGTSDAIRNLFPDVNLIQGNGNLYWVGAMRLAFERAIAQNHSFYLWLNDDTLLESDALTRLMQTYTQVRPDSILVGSTYDRRTKAPTYGGAIRSRAWYSNKFEFVGSVSALKACDTFYGNCVLIPKVVVDRVGNLDPALVHNFGDLDYGLRAKQQGCAIWTMPGFIGSCSQNSVVGSWVDPKLSLIERLKKVTQVKNFPIRPWTVFCQRHSGMFWFLYWFLPYIRAAIGYRNLSASPTFCADLDQTH
ncbi:MAG: glycosyltransferase family 2 protein [Leptolyngbya sp. Prado105]|jgi:GT2 family glycosyltransferase|nr:glycosyltransferase family 2 protein [Leptolyngbya sp. Prado105]